MTLLQKLVLAGICGILGGRTPLEAQPLHEYHHFQMGTKINVRCYSEDSARVRITVTRAFALIDSLNAIFSDYLPESEINQWCMYTPAGSTHACSPHLAALLRTSIVAAHVTRGYFDITAGALTKRWRSAIHTGTFPGSSAIQEDLLTVGIKHLQLHETGAAVLQKPGTRLDFGGIAQGYAAQQMMLLFTQAALDTVLIDIGGDVFVGAAPPGKQGWRIGVSAPGVPIRYFEIHHMAITTSATSGKSMLWNGKHYSHIVHPKTGLGVNHGTAITVIGDDPVAVDYWATALCIRPNQRLLRKARKAGMQVLVQQSPFLTKAE